jgi:hypothetical protein
MVEDWLEVVFSVVQVFEFVNNFWFYNFEILKPKTCSFWFLEKRKEKKSQNQRTGDFHERANKELWVF